MKSSKSLKENASAHDLKMGKEFSGEKVKGYDFNSGVDYKKMIKSYATTGFQATNFSEAVRITNKMIEENAFIFLGYTSNMVSSGLREVIRYLAENKRVNVIVTTAGGIEEDFVKCMEDFKIADFRLSGKKLYEDGLNRIGNLIVSNNGYVKFEDFVQPILEEMYKEKKIWTPSEIIWKLGEKINNKESIYYWAWKNKIQVYCPAIMDGAIGGNIYFFKFKHPDFVVDIAEDNFRMNNTTVGLKKSGAVILGAGVVKHSILLANLLRNGLDYGVYVNTAEEYDGSDSGALPEEAISWGKLKVDGTHIKVFGDATLLFPILVAESFAKDGNI